MTNISGKRIPFTQDWFYIAVHHSGRKFTFQSRDQLSATEMLWVQNSIDEALDGYEFEMLLLSQMELRRR